MLPGREYASMWDTNTSRPNAVAAAVPAGGWPLRVFAVCVLICVVVATRSRAEGSSEAMSLCDLSDVSGWRGLTAEGSVKYKGKPAAVWSLAVSPTASTDRLTNDWSKFNSLAFAMHSAKRTDTGFVVALRSQNPGTEGEDFYSIRIALDWKGWKEFIIPFNEFVRNRQPVGFAKIDSLTFSADGGNGARNPQAVLRLADLRLLTIPSPAVTDSELFSIMDLEMPGLSKVKAAVQSGDLQRAKHEYAEYLRHRDKPVWTFDWRARPRHKSRPEGVDTTEADLTLQHDLISVSVRHKFEGEIDWNLNPIDYREWPWQLNRHAFWTTLGRAYWATGEEKYAREFVFQLRDWATRCAVPRVTSGNATGTWRTIEAGIRMGHSWPEAFYLFLSSPSFTDEALVTFARSVVDHARHLMRHPTGGNWLAMESNGLMHCGVLFPEFKESEEWRSTAAERLYAELDRQVYPDGAQVELSTGYHQVSLRNFVAAWKIARLNDAPMPKDYVAKMQRMYDYNLSAAMPGGTLPGLNDADRTDIRSSLAEGLTFFSDRRDYEWIATDGKQGRRPKMRSVALPYAGQLMMRTGWDPDDLYLLMDAGPFGYGHQHEDSLSFVIYAYGKYIVIDPGNYAYDSSKWRRYVLSTRAHNTIMVDGLDQHRRGLRETYVVSKPLPNRWAAGRRFDYASGKYAAGYGPENKTRVEHTRHVFFVRPEYWIVTDFLSPDDKESHHYESAFHLDAAGATVDEASLSVHTSDADSANLAIVPLRSDGLSVRVVSGQEEPVVQGWMPERPYKVRPIPTPIFARECPGDTTFLYAFYPTPQGVRCPIERIEPLAVECQAGRRAIAAAIHFESGRTDYYVQSEGPGAKVRFLDFETDAEAALVSMRGEAVEKALLAGGTGLNKAGKPVTVETRQVEDLSGR